MVKVITQETFDAVVKENIDDFGMEMAEAVREAKEQFEKQGVNLGNIVISEQGSQVVVAAVLELFQPQSTEQLQASLATILTCCKEDLAQRVLATNNGAYSVLVRLAGDQTGPEQQQVVACLAVVMDTNPDMLEQQGINLAIRLLARPGTLSQTVLDWLLVVVTRHEENRQALVCAGLLPALTALLQSGTRQELLLTARLWVALVQDDDVRVPFGKAHETARGIVENNSGLELLCGGLERYREDKELLSACLAALASLAVRNEYCQQVVDIGGLRHIQDMLVGHTDQAELVRGCLTLTKVLAGNDRVKEEVGKTGGIPLILSAFIKHIDRPGVAEAGCAVVGALTLRQSGNAREVVESEGAVAILNAMEKHPSRHRVQSSAAAAIRNIVSRDQDLRQPAFLTADPGAEQLLALARARHGDKIGDTVRSAQRDLGLGVEFVESWTGEKIQIKQDFKESEEMAEK